MCVRIGRPLQIDISALRENYISPEFLEEQVEADPVDQVEFHYHTSWMLITFYYLKNNASSCDSIINLLLKLAHQMSH